MSMAFMRALVGAATSRPPRPRSGRSVPVDLPDTLDHFLQFRIADLSEDPAAQPWLGRAIVLTEDGRHGPDRSARAGSTRRPSADGRVEIGYRVEPPWRRQGVATECVRALFDWAHEHRASTASALRSRRATSASLAIIGGSRLPPDGRPDRRHRRRGARLRARRLAAGADAVHDPVTTTTGRRRASTRWRSMPAPSPTS